MRAKDFIVEREVKPYEFTELDVAKTVEILNRHCSDSIALVKYPIWRGMSNHLPAELLTLDPSTGKRESQNTSNFYTELLDHSPYMEGWPKRSESIICTSNKNYADDFGGGNLYAIFPYNETKIAICPGHDMWDTGVDLPELGKYFRDGNGMNAFNHFLEHTLELRPTYAAMVGKTKLPAYQEWFSARFPKLSILAKDIVPYLMQQLAPAKTGFELQTVKEYAKFGWENNEVWIGGPVVAMSAEYYDKFVTAVAEQKRNAPPRDDITQQTEKDLAQGDWEEEDDYVSPAERKKREEYAAKSAMVPPKLTMKHEPKGGY